MRKLRVLHLEDMVEDYELVSETLEAADFEVDARRVETKAQFIEALHGGDYDLIIADYALPSFDGLTALELARQQRPDVPFLFVTGALKDDSAVETLRRGATDFIVKDRLSRLVPAIERALREREDRDQRLRAEAALRFLADASAILAASLEFKATLANVARLAVPVMADWCAVELLAEGGTRWEHVAAAHADPTKVTLVEELRRRFSPVPPVTEVIDSESPRLYATVTDAVLEAAAHGPEHLAMLRQLGISSAMVLPMIANGRVLGVITLAIADGRRSFDKRDVATAQNLAERAAVAVENARLYRELQRSVKGRDDLLAVVSHDLRNPAQTIAMSASLLQAHPPIAGDAHARRWIETILRSADMMGRLIDDLLDLARADSGTLTLSRQSHDLSEIVLECVAMASTAAERKRVRLAVDLAPSETRAFCDRGRVLQILGNLVGNALKFTPEDGTVVVGTRVGPEDGQVRIWIADTGPGVAPDEQPFVFDRYWQSPQANHSGVGLGLSIVKAMVEAQGGKVSLASRKGEGARFEFTLPTEEVSRAGSRRPSVLVVDDDPDIRASLAQVLEEVGYRALEASDGEDALAVLRDQDPSLRPSVILLDMMMPRMDGRQFRSIQQRDPELATIPVVVFSAQRDVANTARELGVEGYLEKPLRMGALLEAVARCAGASTHPAPR